MIRIILAFIVFGLTFGLAAPGCSDHQLSGKDLQELKKEEIKNGQGTLSPEAQFQIGTIQANSRSEFEEKVQQIKDADGARKNQG